MNEVEQYTVSNAAVSGFDNADQRDLIDRWSDMASWFEDRAAATIDPYQKYTRGKVGPEIAGSYRNGLRFSGLNFASQDYLSLSGHPAIAAAAVRAVESHGVHSAGSAALMGNTELSVRLEQRLAAFLRYADCTVFPIGWAAGYGAVTTLVRQGDHVVIDILAHACLQEAARNATANVHTVPHLSCAGVERRLKRIREKAPNAGILVVTETVFSMDSDVPDIARLQALCRAHGATLLVDCAHDLGALGKSGLGVLEDQGMVGKVDILMGAFSKTFASPGGFVACNNPALKFALRVCCGPSTFTNAMSPIQAAVILAALDIVEGDEGAERRERLMANALRLRRGLADAEFSVLGQPSAVVPTLIGDNRFSRLATRYAIAAGGIVNLVEYPAVARNSCRWRLQVMSDHSAEQIDRFVDIAVSARGKAADQVVQLDLPHAGEVDAEPYALALE